MENGYYWAAYRDGKEEWKVVEVQDIDVLQTGSDIYYDIKDFKFGDKIVIPDKYKAE